MKSLYMLSMPIAIVCFFIQTGESRADSFGSSLSITQFVLPDPTGTSTNQTFLITNNSGVVSQQVSTTNLEYAYATADHEFSAASGNNLSSVQATLTTEGEYKKILFLSSESEVEYDFEITGPYGKEVPILVSASGSASASEMALNYLITSQFSVYTDSSTSLLVNTCIGSDAAYNGVKCSTDRTSSFYLNGEYTFQTNTPYRVHLDANVTATPSIDLLSVFFAPQTSFALIDPTFSLDPAYASSGLYNLKFSDSLTPLTAATPEPSSILLVITGATFALITSMNIASVRRGITKWSQKSQPFEVEVPS